MAYFLYNQHMLFFKCNFGLSQIIEKAYINLQLDLFEPHIGESNLFDTRVTTIDWHPRQTNLIAVGSKHGDILFCEVDKDNATYFEEKGKIEGVSFNLRNFYDTQRQYDQTATFCAAHYFCKPLRYWSQDWRSSSTVS